MDIKIYEPLLIIYYKDIGYTISTLATKLVNKQIIQDKIQTQKFIEIEGVTLNVNSILKMEEPKNDLENIFFSQTKDCRLHLEAKATKRGYKTWAEFINGLPGLDNRQKLIDEVSDFISSQS